MKGIISFIFTCFALSVYSQSVELIDSMRNDVLKNQENYEKCIQSAVISDGEIDSIWYYSSNNNLVYLLYQKYRGSNHNPEQYAFEEILFRDGKALFMRSWGYTINSHSRQNDTIQVTENSRNYFKHTGESLMCYEMRQSRGKYSERLTLLDSIPLVAKTGWLDCLDRVDSIIENDYLSIFNNSCID